MELWVLPVIAVAVGATVVSWWLKHSFSALAGVACIVSFIVMVLEMNAGVSDAIDQVAFRPSDLTQLSRSYTVLTSMFSHASLMHVFFNVLVLVMIGAMFEQRIGTRKFIIIYLLSGVAGTLTFAAFHPNDRFIQAVGASGAILGVIGAYGRLYPEERVMVIPFPPLPAWVVVTAIVMLQLVFVVVDVGVAWEAHLGGLAAGVLLAPLIVKLPQKDRAVQATPVTALRKLATTPELSSLLKRIEGESVPDVRKAWVEHFLSKARCPACGSKLRMTKDGVLCDKGHLV